MKKHGYPVNVSKEEWISIIELFAFSEMFELKFQSKFSCIHAAISHFLGYRGTMALSDMSHMPRRALDVVDSVIGERELDSKQVNEFLLISQSFGLLHNQLHYSPAVSTFLIGASGMPPIWEYTLPNDKAMRTLYHNDGRRPIAFNYANLTSFRDACGELMLKYRES